MITPRISLVAYENQNFVFVAVPNERGRYFRCEPVVVRAPCPACKASVGEPCFNTYRFKKDGVRKYCSATHADRRNLGRFPPPLGIKVKPKRFDDHLDTTPLENNHYD